MSVCRVEVPHMYSEEGLKRGVESRNRRAYQRDGIRRLGNICTSHILITGIDLLLPITSRLFLQTPNT